MACLSRARALMGIAARIDTRSSNLQKQLRDREGKFRDNEQLVARIYWQDLEVCLSILDAWSGGASESTSERVACWCYFPKGSVKGQLEHELLL